MSLSRVVVVVERLDSAGRRGSRVPRLCSSRGTCADESPWSDWRLEAVTTGVTVIVSGTGAPSVP